MSIKTILISQPEPTNENSPYSSLIRKYKLKIDFRKFIHVVGLTAKDVRAQRVDFSKFHNVILTSRNSVDHFFRITDEMRFKVPDQTKYFCQSEAVAYYLQKYVVYSLNTFYDFNYLKNIFLTLFVLHFIFQAKNYLSYFSKIDIKDVMYFILYLCGFKLAPWIWLYSIY